MSSIGDTFHSPPAPSSVDGLSNLGIDLERSLADIVDNSVEWDARTVQVRFNRADSGLVDIRICDDGRGMTKDEIEAAARMGTAAERPRERRLGRYGMGFKMASLNQTRRCIVVSRSSEGHAGVVVDKDRLKAGWDYERVVEGEAERLYAESHEPGPPPATGTVVIWLAPRAAQVRRERFETLFDKLLLKVSSHLGMTFHRFIERGLRISLVTRDPMVMFPLPRDVIALDPFSYPKRGSSGFPVSFDVPVGPHRLTAEAHILPFGRPDEGVVPLTSANQGLYVYRNDRLVQPGGWNDVQDERGDLALARVKIDISGLDAVGIEATTTKTGVILPPDVADALANADNGRLTFREFIAKAERTFRAGRDAVEKRRNLPVVPGRGYPQGLQDVMTRVSVEDGNARDIGFVWRRMNPDIVVLPEFYDDELIVNSIHRDLIERGGAAASLFKLLLLEITTPMFQRSRTSDGLQSQIGGLNERLRAALEWIRAEEAGTTP